MLCFLTSILHAVKKFTKIFKVESGIIICAFIFPLSASPRYYSLSGLDLPHFEGCKIFHCIDIK